MNDIQELRPVDVAFKEETSTAGGWLAIVEERIVYGEVKVYPVNRPAQLIAALAGHKTLTMQDIVFAKEVGFRFRSVAAVKEF